MKLIPTLAVAATVGVLSVIAVPAPQTNVTSTNGTQTTTPQTDPNVATVNCQSEDIHCITSRGRRHSDGVLTIPCMYADSTGSPNGLECDSYILNSSGDQVGLTGNCGATTNQTPSFLVACRDVKLIDGEWVLVNQTYSSDALVKISFDSVKNNDGAIGTYWQGENGAPEIALRNLTSMSFHLSSLESAQKTVYWTHSGASFIPGVDVLLGCPKSEQDDTSTLPTTHSSSDGKSTTTTTTNTTSTPDTNTVPKKKKKHHRPEGSS